MIKRDKERTKEEIVKAAIGEFMRKGFLEASTLDIARNANVAHSTVFFYFPTKAELIIECIYTKLEVLANKLNEESKMETNVRRLCKLFLHEIGKSERFYTRLVKELPLLPIDVQRMVFGSLSGFSFHFVDAISRGQKEGKIRRFSPKVAMFYWFGMIHYLYSYSKVLGTKNLIHERSEEIIRFFMGALTRKKTNR